MSHEIADVYYFDYDKDGSYKAHTLSYKEDSKKLDGSDLGDMFHVVLFCDDGNGNLTIDDQFEAIFLDPLTYIKRLHGSKFSGILARKTEKSNSILNEIVEKVIGNEKSV